MSKISALLAVGVLLISGLACSLIERAVPGVDMNRTAEMWPDVPKMDHFAPSDMEMPLPLKIVLKTMLNNLWRVNKEGEDKTPATGDWIVFTTTDAPTDVEGFYTNDRMASFGQWRSADKTSCTNGKEKQVNGAVCIFQKTADNKETGLVILAVKDDNTKQTNVFFLRVERPVTQGNKSQTSQAPEPPSGSITKLKGAAPYVIESRPMPTGTDLDLLLPKQVGSYTRAKLERSDQRGTTPESIETDGNSV